MTQLPLRFRLATKADIPQLLPLIQEFYVYDQHHYDEAVILPALETLLMSPHYGFVWLLLVDQEAVGYVVLTYGFALESGGRDALIDEFYLRESYRGKGLGRSVIHFLKAHCQEQKIRVLYLEVEAQNTPAKAFYERVGFESDDSTFMSMDVDA